MAEFIRAVADDLVSGSVGTMYSTTPGSVSIQVTNRREIQDSAAGDGSTIVLLQQTGGNPWPRGSAEEYGFQVLVDSNDVVSGETAARAVYDRLFERFNEVLGGHVVHWLRAVALPQAVPMGPSAGQPPERFMFSVNFNTLILKTGGS